jgi:hypothetical protein
MTDSTDIKQLLNLTYGVADWKRTNKKKLNKDWYLREFNEPKSGIVIQVYSANGRHYSYNGQRIDFGLFQHEGRWNVAFEEPFKFMNVAFEDGIQDIFQFIGKTVPDYLGYKKDNQFFVCYDRSITKTEILSDLSKAGFTYNQKLSDYLESLDNDEPDYDNVFKSSELVFEVRTYGLVIVGQTNNQHSVVEVIIDEKNNPGNDWLSDANVSNLPVYLRNTSECCWQVAGITEDKVIADMIAAGFTLRVEEYDDEDKDDKIPEHAKEFLDPKNPIIFGVFDAKQNSEYGDGICASFATPAQFKRDGYLYDQHFEWILEQRGFKIPKYLSEDSENMFSVYEQGMDWGDYPPTITKEKVIADLISAGLVFNKKLDNFINNC